MLMGPAIFRRALLALPGLAWMIVTLAAGVGPEEAKSNLAAWAKLLGIEHWPSWLTDSFVIVSATVLMVAIYAGVFASYYRKRRSRSDEEKDSLPGEWEAARAKHEKRYAKFRGHIDRFLKTVENVLVVREGYSQQTWDLWRRNVLGRVFPMPDEELYGCALLFWANVEGLKYHGSDRGVLGLKDDFRRVLGFFDKAQELRERFPLDAPSYFEAGIARHHYGTLHVLWYLAHAQADIIYKRDKAAMYASQPGWHRLWASWNPRARIPINPIVLFPTLEAQFVPTPSTPDTEARPAIKEIRLRSGQLALEISQFLARRDEKFPPKPGHANMIEAVQRLADETARLYREQFVFRVRDVLADFATVGVQDRRLDETYESATSPNEIRAISNGLRDL